MINFPAELNSNLYEVWSCCVSRDLAKMWYWMKFLHSTGLKIYLQNKVVQNTEHCLDQPRNNLKKKRKKELPCLRVQNTVGHGLGLVIQAFNTTQVYINSQILFSTSSSFLSKTPTVDQL